MSPTNDQELKVITQYGVTQDFKKVLIKHNIKLDNIALTPEAAVRMASSLLQIASEIEPAATRECKWQAPEGWDSNAFAQAQKNATGAKNG